MNPKLGQTKPKFNYSFLSLLDIFANPQSLYDYIETRKIICAKCKELISIKFNEYNITIKCPCGTGILYPEREDRNNYFLYRFVSKYEKMRDSK